MRRLGTVQALLALIVLFVALDPAHAKPLAEPGHAAEIAPVEPAQAPGAAGAAEFLPADFVPPTVVKAATFEIAPLGPDLVEVDFEAYMSSIDHLQKTFSRGVEWPRKDISHADAMKDMEAEQSRFRERRSFAYAVLTPDGTRERGSVYVSPSPVGAYDAVVRLWVTKAEYDAGFDAELYRWVVQWMRKDWPFRKIAYPGRSIDWKRWDAMIATNGRKSVVKEGKSP